MTITIDEIKTQQDKLAAMIAQYEAKEKLASAYPVTVSLPDLNEGELYVGCIISAYQKKRDHIILLPGEIRNACWKTAMDWAPSIGGTLPDRCEAALLFATRKEQFELEWHWTCEQDAGYDDYAWSQHFVNGLHGNYRKSNEYRARAIRRVSIV